MPDTATVGPTAASTLAQFAAEMTLWLLVPRHDENGGAGAEVGGQHRASLLAEPFRAGVSGKGNDPLALQLIPSPKLYRFVEHLITRGRYLVSR